MIETVRIMIDFNEQRYEALAKKLSKNSRIGSVEKSVERYLEYLYETAVPAGQRKEIEKEIKSAIRLEKASGEPEIKFSVITLRTEGGNISFKSEKLLIFLDLIKCYRDKVRDWENITDLETLKSLFGKSHVVKAESLPLLVNRFCNNQSVTMIADFDFVNDTVSVMKNGSTEWSAYRLKDVASAAFLAYQKPELHLSERRKLFDEYLSDREIPYKK